MRIILSKEEMKDLFSAEAVFEEIMKDFRDIRILLNTYLRFEIELEEDKDEHL